MKDGGCYIALIVLGVAVFLIAKIGDLIKNYSEKKLKTNREIEARRNAVEKAWIDCQERIKFEERAWAERVKGDKLALEILAKEKTTGFPWLASAFADFEHLRDIRLADRLETKKHPAQKAADTVREIASARRTAERAWRIFVTSTTLSDTAVRFANALGIEVSQGVPLERYPCIKCNVSHRDGERIYHLPFDQQYDRTRITKSRGDMYVSTLKEAEQAGFRRAWRWKGTND